MNPLGFTIGSILIPYYGSCIALGVICAVGLGLLQCRLKNLPLLDFTIVMGITALCSFVGAKLLFLLVNLKEIDFSRIGEASYIKDLLGSGFVFYGGFLGGIPGFVLGGRLAKTSPWPIVEACIPCFPLAHAFGRIGCHLVGCCHGCEFSGSFSITYHNSLFAPNDLALFPAQLVESICEIAISMLLLYYIDKERKNFSPKNDSPCSKTSKENKAETTCPLPPVILYAFLYAPVRFVLEFFRADSDRGEFLWFSTSQWISIGLILVGIIFLIMSRSRKQNQVKKYC